jgi:predicted MPP superfamily phosphohydrolase
MGFHTIITLSYLIPGLYIFVRVWQLFIPRRHILHYILVYGILFAIYPLQNLAGDSGSRIREILGIFSGYLIAFMLYVFLSVLVTDVLLLVNLAFRIVQWDRVKAWKFRRVYFACILVLSALVVTGGIINFNTIRISGYKISCAARSSEIKKLRIAFVSDFHLEKSVPAGFVWRFVKKINDVNPDILLYGGDVLEGRGENIQDYEKLLGSIRPEFGMFGVRGNHDRIGEENDNFFSRAGIILLRDSVAVIDHAFSIAGREEAGNHTRMSAQEIAAEAPDSLPLIVIDHRPTEPDQISITHADIAFSGHTHDGQLFPLNFYLRKVYQLSHGYMRKGNTHFFVSSGIRLWGPRVRTAGKSEIMVIDVDFH